MIWITLVWTFMSIAATYTAARAAWHTRHWAQSSGVKYMIAMLIGAALYNAAATVLGFFSFSRVSGPPTLAGILFTFAHMVEIVPLIFFTLYLIGAFRPAEKEQELHDSNQ